MKIVENELGLARDCLPAPSQSCGGIEERPRIVSKGMKEDIIDAQKNNVYKSLFQ